MILLEENKNGVHMRKHSALSHFEVVLFSISNGDSGGENQREHWVSSKGKNTEKSRSGALVLGALVPLTT